MSLRVSVVDVETGDREEVTVPDGDYLLLCTEPCYPAHVQAFKNGTHVLTIRGRLAGAVSTTPAARAVDGEDTPGDPPGDAGSSPAPRSSSGVQTTAPTITREARR